MNNNKAGIFVGSKQFEVKDEANDIVFPVLFQYPSHKPSCAMAFDPYAMEVSSDAKIIEGQFPIVIISYGNSGSPFLYRTVSTFLAKKQLYRGNVRTLRKQGNPLIFFHQQNQMALTEKHFIKRCH
jgi:hypothetical protein